MFARVSRYEGSPTDDVEALISQTEENIVPQVKGVPGFAGLEFLLNRETGDAVSVTFWETEDDMRKSEEEADRIREESNQLSGGRTIDVQRYEVALRVGL